MLDIHPALVQKLRNLGIDFLRLSEADQDRILSLLCELEWQNSVRILGNNAVERGHAKASFKDLIAEIQMADAVRITRLRASGEGREPAVTYWVRVTICALANLAAPLMLQFL